LDGLVEEALCRLIRPARKRRESGWNGMTDCAVFLEEMKREMNQHKHIDELVSRYRVDMPIISAVWDLTKDAASFRAPRKIARPLDSD
jgi:hypothetical protein